ncbi:MAG: branched-chain amino acid ABC transporter permease [Kiritimatiellia bacterium]|nr:branched-chain amino acid ABC transporter permease [Kiritimatiellia bacterium]
MLLSVSSFTSCLSDPGCVVFQLLGGLSMAMVLFLIASGLSLIFGVLRIVNFAHGSMYMMGAFTAYWLVSRFAGTPGHFWIALVLAPLVVALIGGAVEVVLLRHIYRRSHFHQFLLTFGLILIIADVMRMSFGGEFKSISRPDLLSGSVSVMGRPFPEYNFFLIVVALAVALGMWLVLQRTRLGRTIRAAASDREMTSALGVNVPLLFTMVFALGAGLGGLAGALDAGRGVAISPTMDVQIILLAFIVVVVGGLGSFGGSLLGALIIAEVTTFGILLLPQFALAFVFVIMAVVLLLRPWGLLGKPLEE